jgi:predicted phage terminase large subunit-like protein
VPHYYDPLQKRPDGFRLTLSADPAASAKTSADYSAVVVLAEWGFGVERRAHVLYVYREQVTVPQFAHDLVNIQQKWSNTPINIEAVGAFKAIPQMLLELRPDLLIEEIQPVGDKFTRAQGVAAAWNQGRVLVPLDNPPWLEPFLAEITDFTGVGDRHDDQVDALSGAWNNGATMNVWDVL